MEIWFLFMRQLSKTTRERLNAQTSRQTSGFRGHHGAMDSDLLLYTLDHSGIVPSRLVAPDSPSLEIPNHFLVTHF